MKSVEELQEGIGAILKVDGAQRQAARGITTIDPRFLNPGASERFRKMADENLKSITEKNSGLLQEVLTQLAGHDSPDAVEAMRSVFRSNIVPYRLIAIRALSEMSTPEARKVIASRSSFWSFASKEEKNLSKSVLTATHKAACASCAKPLRPMPGPAGPWTGTLEELSKMKLESDHGLVCVKCGAVVCPVCAGKRAGEQEVKEFVCTSCGTRSLNQVYREQT